MGRGPSQDHPVRIESNSPWRAATATNQKIQNPHIEYRNELEIQNARTETSVAGNTAAGGPQQHAILSPFFPSSLSPFLPYFCDSIVSGIFGISCFEFRIILQTCAPGTHVKG